jgi:hypothetical protein
MAKIHILLQGKGGVGKSFIAATLAQYKQAKGHTPLCIDTDPVNATFHSYTALDVQRLKIMEDDEINPRSFDALIEMLADSAADVIIDNGASAFVPLSHYLISNQVPSLLSSMGHELIVHTAITGGQAMFDTVNGFTHLLSQFPSEALFVAWLNPYWGAVEYDGTPFEKMKAYLANKERLAALVRIPTLKPETYGRDLSDMLKARLTFDQALAMPSLTLMTRQRLKIVQRALFDQMDNAMVL